MSRFPFVRAALATMVVIPCAVLAPVSTTEAAGCHGNGCNGRNPEVTGCAADATTIGRVAIDDHASGGTFGRQVVELRYSRHCTATWSRVTAGAGGTAAVTSSSAYMSGFSRSTTRSRSTAGSIYSEMRAGTTTKACGRTSFNHGAVVMVRCVAAH